MGHVKPNTTGSSADGVARPVGVVMLKLSTGSGRDLAQLTDFNAAIPG
jgi:hypothetical protein